MTELQLFENILKDDIRTCLKLNCIDCPLLEECREIKQKNFMETSSYIKILSAKKQMIQNHIIKLKLEQLKTIL